jgi:hypothetical protein
VLLVLLATVLVLLFGAVGSAAAEEVVSDDTAPGDKDPECDDRTVDHQDIQDAVDNASSGETIIVCPGVYNEAVNVDKPVRIVADNPDTTTDAERSVLRDVDGNGTAFAVEADDVSIEGFSIENYSVAGVRGEDTTTNTDLSGINVNRSAVRNSGSGIVLNADGGTLSDATLEEIAFSSNERGVRILAGSTGVVSSVETTDLVINDSSDAGYEVLAGGSGVVGGTVTGVTLDGSLVNDTTGPGVRVAAASSGNVSNVTLESTVVDNNSGGVEVSAGDAGTVDDVRSNNTLVSNSTGDGIVLLADGGDVTGVDVTRTKVNETADGPGLRVAATDDGTVETVNVSTVIVENNDAGGTLVADGGTVRAVRMNESLVSGASSFGLAVVTTDSGTVTDVGVSRVIVNETSVGVALNGSSGEISDTRIEESDIGSEEGNDLAGVGFADGSADNYQNVTVTRNLIRNNNHGVLVDGSVDTDLNRTDANVSYNLIRDNGVGVQNNNSSVVFDARLNYWGDSSGPSSNASQALQDPVYDVLADGNGDSVSEGQSNESNVRFAPAIGGKRTCTDSQLIDPVPNETITFTVDNDVVNETINGPVTDFAGFCVWERSVLPFRTTSGSAAQSILNIPTFVDTASGQVPINRPELNVHEKNQTVNITYEETTGANTSRYANEEAQVLIARVTGQGLDDSATADDLFSVDFDALSGNATVGSDSVEFVTVRNVTLDQNGTLPGGVQFTPDDSGTHVAVLTVNEFDEGYALDGDGNLTGNVHENDLTAIGFEAVAVRETNSTAQPTGEASGNGTTAYTGSNVSFDLDAEFDDGNFTHAVVLYNEDNFTDSTLVLDVNGSFDAENFEFDNGTLNGTVTGPDGIVTENVTITVDGPADSLLNNISVAGDLTVIDNNAATATNATRNETVRVSTDGFQSNGTYRYVHTATAEDGRFSTDDGTIDVVCQSIRQGIDADNNGQIGDIEILDAIDEYWRFDNEVPETCGRIIPDASVNNNNDILDLIEIWRTNTEVTY